MRFEGIRIGACHRLVGRLDWRLVLACIVPPYTVDPRDGEGNQQ